MSINFSLFFFGIFISCGCHRLQLVREKYLFFFHNKKKTGKCDESLEGDFEFHFRKNENSIGIHSSKEYDMNDDWEIYKML